MGTLVGLEGRLAGASETCLSPPPQCGNYKVMAWCPDFSAKSKTPDRLHWSKLKERVNGNFHLFFAGYVQNHRESESKGEAGHVQLLLSRGPFLTPGFQDQAMQEKRD